MFRYGCMRTTVRIDEPVQPDRILHKDLQPDGPVVGYIDGHPIADTIVDEEGHRYSFAGVAPRLRDGTYDMRSLRAGEWIVDHGLVYS